MRSVSVHGLEPWVAYWVGGLTRVLGVLLVEQCEVMNLFIHSPSASWLRVLRSPGSVLAPGVPSVAPSSAPSVLLGSGGVVAWRADDGARRNQDDLNL